MKKVLLGILIGGLLTAGTAAAAGRYVVSGLRQISPAAKGRILTVTGTTSVVRNEGREAAIGTAACPKGFSVVSGGYLIPSLTALEAAHVAVDHAERGINWVVTVLALEGSGLSGMQVTAECAPGGRLLVG